MHPTHLFGQRLLTGILGFVALSAIGGTPAQGAVTFDPPVNYLVPNGPQDIIAVDVNRDGFPDLVVSNTSATCVSVLLNDPAKPGSFLPPVAYPTPSAPSAIAAADVNGDGWPDVAVTSATGHSVTILTNNAGVLRVAGVYSVGNTPTGVAMGALSTGPNALPDVVVTDMGGAVYVLRNNGSGGFGSTTTIVSGVLPRSATIADFDNDGLPDVAVGNAGDRNVCILKGDGRGGLTKANVIALTCAPYAVTAIRQTPTSPVDLVAGNNTTGGAVYLRGRGNGTFDAPVYTAGGKGSMAVAVGDFDANGQMDIATANYSTYDASIFRSLGNNIVFGGIIAPGTYRNAICVADFNGDGLDDVALSNNGNSITVVLNSSVFVRSFTLKDGTVPAGMATRGTISLTGHSPAGGTVIALTVDGDPSNPVASVPPTVTIPAGESSITFDLATWREGTAVISADVNDKPVRATIIVGPPPGGGGGPVDPPGLKGDMDGDGRITLNDAVILLRIANGDAEPGS